MDVRFRLRPSLLALCAIAWTVQGCSASGSSADPSSKSLAQNTLEAPGYVVDQAGLLSPTERQELTAQLSRFEHDTRHQLVVVTVSSLGGSDIAVFTRKLGNRWGIGRKGINDGVVVLVAPNERKARIEVGRGLEPQLTNRFCQDVMDRDMVPAFARGGFGAGINAGVSAIIRRLAS